MKTKRNSYEDFALKEGGNYYPQVVSKECQYIEQNAVRYVIDDLESSSDDSDNSEYCDEEWIKDMKLMFLKKTFFEGAVLIIYFGCLSSQ